MTADELFEAARSLHIEQFSRFVEKAAAACNRGAAEVKLILSENSTLYQRFFCVDFVCNDEKGRVIHEMSPEEMLNVEGFVIDWDGVEIVFEDLDWSDVVLSHDAGEVGLDVIEQWFQRWCDPNESRRRPAGPFSLSAHSLHVIPGEISTDLGTAPTKALNDLHDILREVGAREILVSAGRNS